MSDNMSAQEQRLETSALSTRMVEIFMIAGIFVLMARLWPINQHVVFFSVWVALIAYVVWKGPQKLNHTLVGYIPLGLMGAVFAIMAGSSLWAPEMWRTFSYSVFSFLHFLIGVTVAIAFPLMRIVGGLILSVAGVAIYGIILGIVDPSRGVTAGLVMGEFTNQSELAHFLGVGLVLIISVVRRSAWERILVGLLAGGISTYLFYVGYLTSFVAVFSALWVYLGIAVVRRLGPQRRWLGAGLAALLTVSVTALLWIFRIPLQIAAGKTPDFSGRVPFWEHFWTIAIANPWGGLGWGWLTWLPPGQETPHPVQEFFPAHQGYIEFAYMLGIPAMILIIAVLSLLLARSFWVASDPKSPPWIAWLPALVAYLSVFDLAATFHTRTIGMFFLGLLVVAASGILSPQTEEGGARQPFFPRRRSASL
jgi:hypothetical protein